MANLFTDTIQGLSFQQKRILSEHEMDLELWQGPSLKDLWPKDCDLSDINQVKKAYSKTVKTIEELRKKPIDYSTFNPDFNFNERKTEIKTDFFAADRIMGRCPCPDQSDTLRCCNLKTLDAVQQCGFACAYCSIQSFYSKNQIRVVSDLDKYLANMTLNSEVWHIGTGQSSDSLLLGDDYGTISALDSFAKKNPGVIIELKTKSARTDWLKSDTAYNIISTWSVNAKTVCEKEEHLAAGVNARIQSAKKVSEKGHPVGFHIHPMVYFSNWKQEYRDLVQNLCDNIDPKMTVMIGIGTLIFTKQNLRNLRESKRPTRVTQMPLEPIAGKYSYPFEVKKEMFSYVYSLFPQDWKDQVFFYLCMEDKNLWKPCLQREYQSNEDFEKDMKKFYLTKVKIIEEKN